MDLALAVVTELAPDGCRATAVPGGNDLLLTWAEPFRPVADRVAVGDLVAVSVPTTVVWRWFRAAVLAVTSGHVVLAEPHHGSFPALLPPDRDLALAAGQDAYASVGLTEDWTVVDRVVDGRPADPSSWSAGELRAVADFYREHGWTA